MIPLSHYLILSACLFAIGVAIVITKRNVIVVLMGIELILNAANINLVAFDKYGAPGNAGRMFSLFVIVVAACEAAVALAIVIKTVRTFNTTNLDEINQIKDS